MGGGGRKGCKNVFFSAAVDCALCKKKSVPTDMEKHYFISHMHIFVVGI